MSDLASGRCSHDMTCLSLLISEGLKLLDSNAEGKMILNEVWAEGDHCSSIFVFSVTIPAIGCKLTTEKHSRNCVL